eukprot:2343535-Prymnesium_polylepis.2
MEPSDNLNPYNIEFSKCRPKDTWLPQGVSVCNGDPFEVMTMPYCQGRGALDFFYITYEYQDCPKFGITLGAALGYSGVVATAATTVFGIFIKKNKEIAIVVKL